MQDALAATVRLSLYACHVLLQVYCGLHQNCCGQRQTTFTAVELRKATSTRSPLSYTKYTVVKNRTLTSVFHQKVILLMPSSLTRRSVRSPSHRWNSFKLNIIKPELVLVLSSHQPSHAVRLLSAHRMAHFFHFWRNMRHVLCPQIQYRYILFSAVDVGSTREIQFSICFAIWSYPFVPHHQIIAVVFFWQWIRSYFVLYSYTYNLFLCLTFSFRAVFTNLLRHLHYFLANNVSTFWTTIQNSFVDNVVEIFESSVFSPMFCWEIINSQR